MRLKKDKISMFLPEFKKGGKSIGSFSKETFANIFE